MKNQVLIFTAEARNHKIQNYLSKILWKDINEKETMINTKCVNQLAFWEVHSKQNHNLTKRKPFFYKHVLMRMTYNMMGFCLGSKFLRFQNSKTTVHDWSWWVHLLVAWPAGQLLAPAVSDHKPFCTPLSSNCSMTNSQLVSTVSSEWCLA